MPYINTTFGGKRIAFIIIESIPNIGERLCPYDIVEDIARVRIEDDLSKNKNLEFFDFYIVMTMNKYGSARFEHFAVPKEGAPDLSVREDQPTMKDLREYGYLYEDMLPLTLEEAIVHWVYDGFSILRLYEDNTEGYALSATDFIDHWERGGMLGIELVVKQE